MGLELDTSNRRLVATICNEIEGTYVANEAALKLSYYKDLFHRSGPRREHFNRDLPKPAPVSRCDRRNVKYLLF